MRRVVISGYGIVSSIGNNGTEVASALQEGRSGISFMPEYAEKGFRSQVAGDITLDYSGLIDRKLVRFMGDGAAYGYVAMKEALVHAGLSESEISDERIGLIAGTGGLSSKGIHETISTFEARGARKVRPYYVPQTMGSSISANLATAFKIRGVNYSITSACATSAHCIGNAYEQIQLGKQDMIFAGGGDELYWPVTLMFDAMGALSSKYNETPEQASRAYDAERDGFVISGGAGMVVVEEYERAKARGANILAELVGYAATSDGADMVAPSGEGAGRCMRMAAEQAGEKIDYVNTHGTSTPAGDITELHAIRDALGEDLPKISSTKSLTGHAIGAAGVNEFIYSLVMMEHRFIVGSANITQLDPKADGFPIVQQTERDAKIDVVLSNSFGFGGTNACLVAKRV
ncbi:MAG: 3-oxoacyl-[acyl-carrier-protein] synthase-1 [Kiritimatiellia bacterium]|jgi:3-oxoacyl-[acyl-carrier-protein] synthase-1